MKKTVNIQRMRRAAVLLAVTFALQSDFAIADDKAPVVNVKQLLQKFEANWNDADWLNKSQRRPGGYMRPTSDKGWRARMTALQSIVAGGKASVPDLVAALKSANTPTRVLAAQALGYLAPHAPMDALRQGERNNDVCKHIAYAKERKTAPVNPAIVKALLKWNPKNIGTAKVGKPAPDFTLKSATGETVRLKDFRWKKPVVLVFIYSDT